MGNQENNQSQNVNNRDEKMNVQKSSQQPAVDSAQVVNPSEDLVYKGGYTNDPEEILSNPAVAPEMLDDRRDIRADLSRDPDSAQAD